MKKTLILSAAIAFLSCKNQAQTTPILAENGLMESELLSIQPEKKMEYLNIYQFKVKDLEGNEFDFSKLKGKKIMIVNTASKCGYTSQYADLQSIYEKFKDKNFVVIGFPSNDFGNQEPGTETEIGAFCQKNYGVTFPMMSKVKVVGTEMTDIYKFLTQKSLNSLQDSKVEWNFQKYLIDENGNLFKVLKSGVKPTDPQISDWIQK